MGILDLDQNARGAKFHSPLGPGILALRSFTFHEELGGDFRGNVEVLSPDFNIEATSLLGQKVSIELDTMGGGRFFHAILTDFAFVGSTGSSAIYQAVLQPWTHVLDKKVDCRIFQNMTAPDIINSVVNATAFKEYLDSAKLSDTYRAREYCVQYNESDRNFIYRLMQEEGIAAHFVHTDESHILTLSDWEDGFEAMPGYETLPYFPETGAMRSDGEHIYQWLTRSRLTSGSSVALDYDFKAPGKDMVDTNAKLGNHENDDQEVFRWPGGFVELGDGERYNKLGIERLQVDRERVSGESNARGLSAGHTFSLYNFPRQDQNISYLILSVQHKFTATDYRSGSGGQTNYQCRFDCMDAEKIYRPKRTALVPRMAGPQTARVVGPEGEEIHTDEYGRIKVRFYWDRHGPAKERGTEPMPENSSVWMRVVQPWGGSGWGMQTIPRIGQEVLIEFLEGDPDRPICTGAVYNGDNKPPFTLPENKTQSGMRSNSTKGGGGFNQFMMEDKKGEEYIHIVGEKDMIVDIKNERHMNIGSNYIKTVHADQAAEIKGSNQKVIGGTETVQTGGNRWVNVGASQYYEVAQDMTLDTLAGSVYIKAKTNITLECGAARIQLSENGTISISGSQIDIDASGAAVLKGNPITLN